MRSHVQIGALIALFIINQLAWAGEIRPDTGHHWRPTGKGSSEVDDKPDAAARAAAAATTSAPTGYGIVYHGGPVMTNTTGNKVYLIWYGNWSANTATTIVPDFVSKIGGTPYFNINTTYGDAAGKKVVNAISLGGQTSVAYPYGTALTDANINAIVSDSIVSGHLPVDANAVYFVLTSKDVNETSGFCTAYCGWHSATTIASQAIKYAFVGDSARCPSACAMLRTTSPNGNIGADGMVNIIAHELEEAITDPLLNAWYSTTGQENGDKCAWTFGTTYAANGSTANMLVGTRNYMIQQNWVNLAPSGRCAKAYP
jgi:hypothetical protein